MTTPLPDLLTFTRVAEHLGVGVQDVRRWVRTEQCPTVREGRRVRIPAAWVADPKGWIA
jgi:excisionase family DNA binding protein